MASHIFVIFVVMYPSLLYFIVIVRHRLFKSPYFISYHGLLPFSASTFLVMFQQIIMFFELLMKWKFPPLTISHLGFSHRWIFMQYYLLSLGISPSEKPIMILFAQF